MTLSDATIAIRTEADGTLICDNQLAHLVANAVALCLGKKLVRIQGTLRAKLQPTLDSILQ